MVGYVVGMTVVWGWLWNVSGVWMAEHQCPDCAADPNMQGKTPRPVAVDKKSGKPVPRKRCTTHHRAVVAERKKRSHGQRTETVFGLSREDYWALWEFQRAEVAAKGGTGVDPIDHRSTGAARALAVDHDHETGEVRGLLAYTTNFELLGKFDRAALVRALEYLDDPPARRFFGGPRFVPEGNT